MRRLILLILFCITQSSFAQFAVIHDKDGHCNVRENAGTGSRIIDSLENGHFVYVFEMKGNWANIDYRNRNTDGNGFIYKDRYQLVTDLTSIPLMHISDTLTEFANDSIRVAIAMKPFDRKAHTYSYYNHDPKIILKIDHKQFWGTDGEMPKTQYRYICIRTAGKKIFFPAAALENLYEVNMQAIQVNEDRTAGILYIQCMNSDGAGGYEVIWKFEKGKYAGRYIAYGF